MTLPGGVQGRFVAYVGNVGACRAATEVYGTRQELPGRSFFMKELKPSRVITAESRGELGQALRVGVSRLRQLQALQMLLEDFSPLL